MGILCKELPCSPSATGCIPYTSGPRDPEAVPTNVLHISPRLAAEDWVCSNSWVKPEAQIPNLGCPWSQAGHSGAILSPHFA